MNKEELKEQQQEFVEWLKLHGRYNPMASRFIMECLFDVWIVQQQEIERLKLLAHIAGKNLAICEDENRKLSYLLDEAEEVLDKCKVFVHKSYTIGNGFECEIHDLLKKLQERKNAKKN